MENLLMNWFAMVTPPRLFVGQFWKKNKSDLHIESTVGKHCGKAHQRDTFIESSPSSPKWVADAVGQVFNLPSPLVWQVENLPHVASGTQKLKRYRSVSLVQCDAVQSIEPDFFDRMRR